MNTYIRWNINAEKMYLITVKATTIKREKIVKRGILPCCVSYLSNGLAPRYLFILFVKYNPRIDQKKNRLLSKNMALIYFEQ